MSASRARLYVGSALASGSWAFLVAWSGEDKNCVIDGCFWDCFFLWTGFAIILLTTVALLVRRDRTRFPTKPLALISVFSVGAVILSLVAAAFVEGLEEPAETVIGLIVLFVLGTPAVFILVSAVWLFFPRRRVSHARPHEQ